jgi:hypothetical protein
MFKPELAFGVDWSDQLPVVDGDAALALPPIKSGTITTSADRHETIGSRIRRIIAATLIPWTIQPSSSHGSNTSTVRSICHGSLLSSLEAVARLYGSNHEFRHGVVDP